MISPPLNFDKMVSPRISLDTSYEDWDENSSLDILLLDKKEVSTNQLIYVLDVPVACADLIAESCWLHSGEIALDSYSGIKYLAFRYRGVRNKNVATTFCLNNIRLGDL